MLKLANVFRKRLVGSYKKIEDEKHVFQRNFLFNNFLDEHY